jgi:solute carrier family 25 oxoglutarate transporter 11
MNYSYKRYWEPSTTQVVGLSLAANAVSTAVTYPLEFVKTRSQVRTEGVGLRGKNLYMGINPNKVFREIHATG